MMSVLDVRGMDQVVPLIVWVFVTLGATKVLFQSFLATELLRWFRLRNTTDAALIRQLQWELRHKILWNPEAAQGDMNAARIPLEPSVLEHKHRHLSSLMQITWKTRMLIYFTSCSFCQFFWTALLLWLAVNGRQHLFAMMLSAVAYAAAATLVHGLAARQLASLSSAAAGSPHKGCSSCGK
jgi:hypothetical protein